VLLQVTVEAEAPAAGANASKFAASLGVRVAAKAADDAARKRHADETQRSPLQDSIRCPEPRRCNMGSALDATHCPPPLSCRPVSRRVVAAAFLTSDFCLMPPLAHGPSRPALVDALLGECPCPCCCCSCCARRLTTLHPRALLQSRVHSRLLLLLSRRATGL
jgi:hypothetical protein